ncbi:MAG: DMT family transporter, partial [Bdellovibrionota bacterium]
MKPQSTAVLELVIAGALWGFGFIAAVFALEQVSPIGIQAWRFTVAFGVGAIILLVQRKSFDSAAFKLAIIPGLMLSATLILQTWGLKYTSATKSGFITVLYILVVPLLEYVFRKKSIPRYHLAYVVAALVGVALVCGWPRLSLGAEDSVWNFGDTLTLACAVVAAIHIFWVGLISEKIEDAFKFNVYQSFWAGAIPLAIVLVTEPLVMPTGRPLFGLMMLAIGSTLIGFALQVKAQKVISASLASLLFLLES